jgi:hypothetical protein
MWAAKNIDTANLRKLINGLAVMHNRTQQQIELLATEFDINQTVELLPDWETSVSLPDECKGLASTLELRRQDVIIRLRKTPLVTLAELQAFVDQQFPDMTIRLFPGIEYSGLEFELEVELIGGNTSFVIIAEVVGVGEQLEYELEVELTAGIDTDAFTCLMNKIIPANVLLQIVFVEA